MHIEYLKIGDFKNIHNIELNFSSKNIQVFLGDNATGKSNIFEAIFQIFKNLYNKKEHVNFSYEICYNVKNNKVMIKNDKFEGLETININGDIIKETVFRKNKDIYLPDYIFSYYSGINDRLEKKFQKLKNAYYDKFRKDNTIKLRSLFYIEKYHAKTMLLSLFSYPNKFGTFLNDFFDIESFEQAIFKFHEPWWRNPKSENQFWDASGVDLEFLSDLALYGEFTPKEEVSVILSNMKPTQREEFDIIINNQNNLFQLNENYANPLDYLQLLDSIYLSDLITNIEIYVKKNALSEQIEISELSEGELQYLTILGLQNFVKDNDVLYLLDEPDTHLHPKWKYSYLHDLTQRPTLNLKNQYLIISHDPLFVNAIENEQVFVFSYQNNFLKVENPSTSTIGMGVEGILTSEYFGLNATLDKPTLDLLEMKRKFTIKIMNKTITKDERDDLRDVNKKLIQLGFYTQNEDPFYNLFVKEYNDYLIKQRSRLDELSSSEKEEMARSIIKKIMEDE